MPDMATLWRTWRRYNARPNPPHELVAGIDAGVTRSEDWTEIGDVAAERSPGRTRVDQITFFKSVGHAVQDIVTASRIMKRAAETGLARTVEL